MHIDGAVIHDDEHGKCGLFSPRHFLHQIASLADSPSFFPCFSFSRDPAVLCAVGFVKHPRPRGSARMVCPAG